MIKLGERIKGTMTTKDKPYVVTANETGHILVRLRWADDDSGAMTLRLKVDGDEVDWNCWSGTRGPEKRVAVLKNEHVRIRVMRGWGCWDYGPDGSSYPIEFTLTASEQ